MARCVAKYYDSEERNLRFAYTGNVFLNNSSYQLKLKETCQMGAELINETSSRGDGEIIAMALDCCLNAGLKDFRLTIGQVEYFQGLVECIGDEDVKEQLRELIINKNFFGLIEFVEGLDIPQNIKDVFVQFNELNGDVDILDKADALVSNETSKKAIQKLRKVYRMLEIYGLEQYISFDLGMLSRHNYYTGVIFKAYTYGTGDAVLKGGRYDNLIEQFGKKAPSVGFAIVLDNLMMAMERQKIEMEADTADMLIIYEEDAMEAAIPAAVGYRKENKTVILEKRDRGLEEYQAMALDQSIGCILYYETRDTVRDLTKGQ